MLDFTAIGEVLIDFAPSGEPDGKLPTFTGNPGGAPANAAAALARLGHHSALIACVGNDAFGALLRDTLRECGIDVSGVRVTDEANTTLAFVHLDEDGDRSFSFYRKPGADMMLTEDDLPADLIERSRILHFGSVTLTHEPARSATKAAVERARAAGATITFDPNVRLELWTDEAAAREQIRWGLERADIVKVSEEEVLFLTGIAGVERGAAKLRERFAGRLLVVTLGERGCYYEAGGSSGYVRGYEVDVVNTTGAGDAFFGCLLHALLEYGLDSLPAETELRRALAFANAGGALVTTRPGALRAMPAAEEAAELMERAAPHDYTENFRPQFHFTPERHWMNDPNGLVFYEGEYHLFYQHHPHSSVWGPMHWGHAISRDLIRWEHRPIALLPDEHGFIFSGCCVVDPNDSSGWFGGGSGLVALFTHASDDPGSGRPVQRQSLAYSRDKGRTWEKYAGNPVLEEADCPDFRDPKVFWHADTGRWIMLLAAGDHIRFYRSADLKSWEFASEFGRSEGSHDGVWECPDLFELPVEGGDGSRWVMIVSIGDNPACPEGSRTQYFTGRFDGLSFVNDAPAGRVLWLDHGRDNYAGVTWSDVSAEDGRRLFIGWMSNWKYANITPTEGWRSAMTLPRTLSLRAGAEQPELVQLPVREVESLREATETASGAVLAPGSALRMEAGAGLIEIEAEIGTGSAEEISISFRSGESGETTIGYEPEREWLYIDRTHSGVTEFHEAFACRHGVRARSEDGRLKLRIWLDRSSVEVFADGGAAVLTDQIFPSAPVDGIEFRARGGEVRFERLNVHRLGSAYAEPAAHTIEEGSLSR